MAWIDVPIDLVDVDAVQEAVEWAESNMDERLDALELGPHTGRTYVVYAKVPGDDAYLQLVGRDPVRAPGADNLPHRGR